jgi:hypothetical protein
MIDSTCAITRHAFLSCVAVLAAGCSLENPEVVSMYALEDISIVDPNTVAGSVGSHPIVLGVLSRGQSLPVLDCRPRKSDIDVIVKFEGQLGVPWGRYRLERSSVPPGTSGSITSCLGLLAAMAIEDRDQPLAV